MMQSDPMANGTSVIEEVAVQSSSDSSGEDAKWSTVWKQSLSTMMDKEETPTRHDELSEEQQFKEEADVETGTTPGNHSTRRVSSTSASSTSRKFSNGGATAPPKALSERPITKPSATKQPQIAKRVTKPTVATPAAAPIEALPTCPVTAIAKRATKSKVTIVGAPPPAAAPITAVAASAAGGIGIGGRVSRHPPLPSFTKSAPAVTSSSTTCTSRTDNHHSLANSFRSHPSPVRLPKQSRSALPTDRQVVKEISTTSSAIFPSSPADLVEEMLALPRSKRIYLLDILEKMEKDLHSIHFDDEGSVKEQEKEEENRHAEHLRRNKRDIDPLSESSDEEKDEEGNQQHRRESQERVEDPEVRESECGTNVVNKSAYPVEVLRIWSKLTQGKGRRRERPQEGETAKIDSIGASLLRSQIHEDFGIRLTCKDIAILIRTFPALSDARQMTGNVNYRAIRELFDQRTLPGYPVARDGDIPTKRPDVLPGLSVSPQDELSKVLLKKLSDTASQTSSHQVLSVFPRDYHRTILVPLQEFKSLVSTGLKLHFTPSEFSLLVQWFGNSLNDKSAAVDLNAFSQTFWSLGEAIKMKRGRIEVQEIFLRALSGGQEKRRERKTKIVPAAAAPSLSISRTNQEMVAASDEENAYSEDEDHL